MHILIAVCYQTQSSVVFLEIRNTFQITSKELLTLKISFPYSAKFIDIIPNIQITYP